MLRPVKLLFGVVEVVGNRVRIAQFLVVMVCESCIELLLGQDEESVGCLMEQES